MGPDSHHEPAQNQNQVADARRRLALATETLASSPQADHRTDTARTSAPNFSTLDRSIRAAQARATQGLSPISLVAPWADWAFHLARAPGKQMSLAVLLQSSLARLALWTARAAGGADVEPLVHPAPGDR